MTFLRDLFGTSPFGPLVEHTKRVHECVKLVRPLIEAAIAEDREEIHRLQDLVSRHEYEADKIKNEIREHLSDRYFLPVERDDLEAFLHNQDSIADAVEDFAVVLLIRRTPMHAQLAEGFREYAEQVVSVSEMLMGAADELLNLAETSFGGAEADRVLEQVKGLNEAEWKVDRLQRRLSIRMYELEAELDPVTIVFYEKILHTLGTAANAAEKTGDVMRTMIVKG